MNLNEFCDALQGTGIKALRGDGDTAWVTHERFSMLRLPASNLTSPRYEEISRVFKKSRSVMLGYATHQSTTRPTNAVLYVCSDPYYSLEKLERPAQITRGLREFEIKFIDHNAVQRLGQQAYCNTLARTGSSLGQNTFEKAFGKPRSDRRYVGAIKDGRLAAFLQLTKVDDWASIGGYSADEFLPLRPNNALVFYAVRHCFEHEQVRVVDYGFSSLQTASKADGLHRFKLKMGFEAIPVHRVFVVHPLLRPFVNRLSSAVLRQVLKLSSQNRVLQKAEGALRLTLGTSR